MKKFIYSTLIILISFAVFNPYYSEAKLLDKISQVITNKTYPNVCLIGTRLENVYPYLNYINVVNNCYNSDLILTKTSNSSFSKPYFALSYESLIYDKNAIGGLYWLNGRLQLVFVKERLERFGIRLPEDLRKYEVSLSSIMF